MNTSCLSTHKTARTGLAAATLTMLALLLASCPAPTGAGGDKALSTFGFASPAATGVIDEASGSIEVVVPFGTDIGALVAVFTCSGAKVMVRGVAQESGVTANDFTRPLAFKVVAADGSSTSYLVRVRIAESDSKLFTDFWLDGAWGASFDDEARTMDFLMPHGSSVTDLCAYFTSTGASVRIGDSPQASGLSFNDFTDPVIYTVVAADGSTADYRVSVTVALDPANSLTSFSFPAQATAALIDEAAGSIVATLPYWTGSAKTDIGHLVASFATTGVGVSVEGAAQASAVTSNDFSSPLTYRVTAEDGGVRDYEVAVTIAPAPRAITAFSVPALGVTGSIDEAAKTILAILPEGSAVGNLVANFTLSFGASASVGGAAQLSGATANDFGSALTYRVTGDDGGFVDYAVTVVATPPAPDIAVTGGFVKTITISSPIPGAVIRYTTDGTTPGMTSPLYAEPLSAAGYEIDMTIRAIAIDSGARSAPALRELRVGSDLGSLGANVSTLLSWPYYEGDEMLFFHPKGIVVLGGYLYFTDAESNGGGNCVRRMDLASGTVSHFAGSLAGEAGLLSGFGSEARFSWPQGMATDGSYLYVADSGNNCIRRIEISTREVSTLAGNGTQDTRDGIGSAARFQYPAGLTTDGKYLYVADTGSMKIRRIELATREVTTIAGGSYGHRDGIGLAAELYHPTGIATDGANLYVTEASNQDIRKIVIDTAEVSTLAGSGTQASVDGQGLAASFSNLGEIATDGTWLFVVESGGARVRKVEIATGIVTTFAGWEWSSQSEDGVGSMARFQGPYGITTDGNFLYVADPAGLRIRKIE